MQNKGGYSIVKFLMYETNDIGMIQSFREACLIFKHTVHVNV